MQNPLLSFVVVVCSCVFTSCASITSAGTDFFYPPGTDILSPTGACRYTGSVVQETEHGMLPKDGDPEFVRITIWDEQEKRCVANQRFKLETPFRTVGWDRMAVQWSRPERMLIRLPVFGSPTLTEVKFEGIYDDLKKRFVLNLIPKAATPNHALQRTAPRVTVAAISCLGVSRPSHLLS